MKTAAQHAEEIFSIVIALPPQERDAYLNFHYRNDPVTLARIRALIEGYEKHGDFLETPAATAETSAAASMDPSSAIEPKPGDFIGAYRLLEPIGEGGFGIVFLAEQTAPLHRNVALKLIRLGLDTREFIRRFAAERQALELMDHPHIARVFDAGTTDRGRPYLVMELVRGEPITRYCDGARLPLRARLELFLQVCGAIQHAHQKGIIHRDLKPSNILVTTAAGTPEPKLIDFGIAKAIREPFTGQSLVTQHHTLVGTPAYTSPEQMGTDGHVADTRSDIYSLGSLLYELLAGAPPFDREVFQRASFEEMCSLVREVEPPRPSARIAAFAPAQREEIANRRCLDPEKLLRGLHTDLDWIVMRCLEKDPARRYATANALALDIRRHLENEPVAARPPSRGYRLQKYLRRHRTPVVAAASATLALVIGFVATGVSLVREKTARADADNARRAEAAMREQSDLKARQARAAADKSRQVAHFMKAMLGSVGPSVARGRDTTLLRELLDETIRRLDTELRDQPEVAADLRHTLGVALREIGEYGRATALWREAIAARRALGDNDSAELSATLHALGSLLWRVNEVDQAEAALQEALAIRETTLGPDHFDVGTTLTAIAHNMGAHRSARERDALSQRAVEIQRKFPGHNDEEFAQTLMIRGFLLSSDNRDAEAVPLLEESLAIRLRLHGDIHPRVADSLAMISWAIYFAGDPQGKNPEGLKVRRRVLRIVREVRGLANSKLIAALLDFTASSLPAETLADDLRLVREVLADLQRVMPEDSPDLAVAQLAASTVLALDPQNAAEAAALSDTAVHRIRRARERDIVPHRDVSAAMQFFVIRAHAAGRLQQALPLAEELNADRIFGATSPYGPPIARGLGWIYFDLGRYADAVPLLEQNALPEQTPLRPLWRPVQRAHLFIDFAFLGHTHRKLGALAESRRILEIGLARKIGTEEEHDPAQAARAAVRAELAYTAMAEGNFVEAEALFRAALKEYEAPVVNEWDKLRPRGRVVSGLGQALAGQGKFVEAEPLILEGLSELLAARETLHGDPGNLLNEAYEAVVSFYRASGQREKAMDWESKRRAQ